MLTKNHIKLIASLHQKKYRQQHGLFVVEGVKGVQEFLNSHYELFHLFATAPIFDAKTIEISDKELNKISQLKSPNKALAVFRIPQQKMMTPRGLVLALDDVRDPGNLGTIIRLCDWFGIENLVCSKATVDCYNTKVVQATMGSLTRVSIQYVDLEHYLKSASIPVFGTFMDGDSIYSEELPTEGIVIMGNEANGISDAIAKLVTKKLRIPRFGRLQATESLNVATATAIVLSEFKRS
ncbi:MAG: RNA methyltransferase [Algicola sp.]|nr:RNA methyltransferase [Algicola sp.]